MDEAGQNKAKNRVVPAGVLLIAWGHFAHDIFSSFFAPLLPILQERLGLSFAAAGFLTAFQRVPALANPLLGLLADRTRVRWMLVVAPTITALAMSSISLADSRVSLALLLLVSGLGSALWHVPSPVFLAQIGGRRIGLGMSLFMVAGEAARSVGPFLVLGAVTLWGPAGPQRLVPIALLTSVALFFATRGIEPTSKRAKGGDADGEPWGPLIRLFAHIALVIGGRSFLVASLTTFLPVYVIARGGSLWLGGAALALLQGAGAVGALGSGTLSDRIGRRKVLLIAACASPVLMVALVLSPGILTIPILLLLGIFTFSTNPPLLALVQERAGSRPALANSLFMTTGFVLRSAVVVVVGYVADVWGLERAFLVSAIVATGAIPGVLALPGRSS